MTKEQSKFVKNSMPTRDDQTLFRPDAIQSSGASWLGPIRLGSPVHHHVYAVIALFVTLANILELITAEQNLIQARTTRASELANYYEYQADLYRYAGLIPDRGR